MSWVGELLAKYTWLRELLPIVGLLVVIVLVVHRLPRVDLGHSPAFLRRRFFNWFPVGLTYAFLYMARYNLNTLSKMGFIEPTDFSVINTVFAITYGVSFIINGPLTDRYGGKITILVGVVGAAAVNLAMGLMSPEFQAAPGMKVAPLPPETITMFAVLTGLNAYFQSFGAVAIVKINAPWFDIRERGTFGAIFGILISLGLWLAFDWTQFIAWLIPIPWVFYAPSMVLFGFAVWIGMTVRNTPEEAGYRELEANDASLGDHRTLGVGYVFKKMLTNPIILTIALVEFCSGFLRQSTLQYYRSFTGAIGHTDFVTDNWGALSCCAGILGGIFAGVISDRLFDSRRGPVSAVLYAIITVGALLAIPLYTEVYILGPLILVMSMSVIGVHGMLSGTASMDFGGKKNAGVAVGIIDGFVYLGYGAMALLYSFVLPEGAAKKDPANWLAWPISMVPMAILGFFLARRLWNARPQRGGGGH